MIGKIVSFFAVVAVVYAASAGRHFEDYRPYDGVDPNTLSCDPLAKELLLLPTYDNCSQFYMCVHGDEVLVDCAPGGLVFDFGLQGCNWAWAAPCETRTREEGSGEKEVTTSSSDVGKF